VCTANLFTTGKLLPHRIEAKIDPVLDRPLATALMLGDDGQTCADRPSEKALSGLVTLRLPEPLDLGKKIASAYGDSGKPRAFARNAALSSDLTALRSAPFIVVAVDTA
jgi:hypothetical protein